MLLLGNNQLFSGKNNSAHIVDYFPRMEWNTPLCFIVCNTIHGDIISLIQVRQKKRTARIQGRIFVCDQKKKTHSKI